MPAINTVKTFVEDAFYHVYNRGVEKRDIFLDDHDYQMFLHLLKLYLSPQPEDDQNRLTRNNLVRLRPAQSVAREVKLIAYCLMPNHFHLLLKQITRTGMTKLMRKLATAYAMYFNSKYTREGTLFQGIYKAIHIDSEYYLLHLSRYIHLNPQALTRNILVTYPYSSYAHYLGKKHAEWVDPAPVLSYFSSEGTKLLKTANTYKEFVEAYKADPKEVLGRLALDED